MRTNGDLTLYTRGVNPTTRAETWTRSIIRGVYWENRRAASYSRGGGVRQDSVLVMFALAKMPNPPIKPGDIVVRGAVTDEISSAFTLTDLRAKYSESGTVGSIDKMDTGNPGIQHYEIEGQ